MDDLCAVEDARHRDGQVRVGRHRVVGALHREDQRQLATDVLQGDDDLTIFVGAGLRDLDRRLAWAITVDRDGEALVDTIHRQCDRVRTVGQGTDGDRLADAGSENVGLPVEHERCVDVVAVVLHRD